MHARKALLVVALLAPSIATGQRAARISSARAVGAAPAIGMIGDGNTNNVVVFDANTDAILAALPLTVGSGSCYGDGAITSDLSLGFVVTVGSVIWIVDLTTSPPSLASGTNPISLRNFGLDVALTSDDRFLVVCGGNAVQPIQVVDVATRTVVENFSFGNDTIAVDVGPDGSVLAASDVQNRVRRLTIDATGNLTYTGEFLAETDPINLNVLPGAPFGLLVKWNTRQARSFTMPGLAATATLTAQGSDFGVCALVDPVRNRIYYRTGQDPFTRRNTSLQAFPFDPATGTFGTTPDWNVSAGYVLACYGVEQLALHPDGSKLYTSALGGVEIRDPDTGALLGKITHPAIVEPAGIAVRGLEASELVASLDIKPGECPNPFNRKSRGVLPVALVGSDELDVTRVDVTTLRLARGDGAGGSVAPNEGPRGPHTVVGDVATPFAGESCGCHALAGDGTLDLESKFESEEVVAELELDALAPGALVELVLTGELLDGTAFSARDCVRLVPPGAAPATLTISTARGGSVHVTPPDLELDGAGSGTFQRTYPRGSLVTLTASDVPNMPFVAWVVDGVQQKSGQRTLQLQVQRDSDLKAVYAFSRVPR
jgi:hypothetical protein